MCFEQNEQSFNNIKTYFKQPRKRTKMGTRSSKQQVKVNHFLFGKVTLKNQFNKELITWHKPMVRVDEFLEWQARYKKAVTMNKQSLLLPQSYDKMKIQKFFMCCECPADTQIALTYEKFQFTLEKQINTRKAESKYFQQAELFYIMYKLLEACKEFQLRNQNVGDLRPQKVVKCKNGDLKLINVASFPQEYNPIQKILDQFDNRTIFFLAPEEIQFLKSKGYNAGDYPNPKTEAFSLGLLILECATLTPSADLYQLIPTRSLNQDELKFRLSSLQQKYPKFTEYLKKICEVNPDLRLSTGEMWACLNVYSSSICQLRDFSPKETSQKSAINEFRNKMAKIKAEKRAQN